MAEGVLGRSHLCVLGLAFPINLQSLLRIQLIPPPDSTAIDKQLVVWSQLHSLQDTEPKDVVDFTVTCDGTWSRRGFMATYSVVVVMLWDSGQVLHIIRRRSFTSLRDDVQL